MSTKSETFIEAAMYALNGLTGNSVNQGLSAAQLVEKALNIGLVFANRVEQIVGVANMTPKISQQFALTPLPTDPILSLTANGGDAVNVVQQSQQTSVTPTLVTNPGGEFVAGPKDRGV